MSVAPSKTMTPLVLFVCSGNICRSPLAELLFRTRTAELGRLIRVASAGTSALVGSQPPDEIIDLAMSYGGGVLTHQGTQITPALAVSADLILTATRQHSNDIVRSVVGASRKTFTLLQFARLLDSFIVLPRASDSSRSPMTFRRLVSEVADLRGHVPLPDYPDDDDIADPYRESIATYDLVGAAIDEATRFIASGIDQVLDDH